MSEREGIASMKGNPVVLVGPDLKAGDDAPNCTLVANDLSEVELSSFKGKKVLLSIVPSLDTPVCDLQTKRFNEEAASLGDNVAVLTVSKDLPFAQKRWCAASNAENVQTLSDFRGNFGESYGFLIKGVGLLARGIVIVDENGTVQYVQTVPEITSEPDYDAALSALKSLQNA